MQGPLYSTTPGIHELRIGGSVLVYVVKPDGDVELASLRTPRARRGKGHGSAALAGFLRAMDTYGKVVRLLASPLDKATKTNRLVSFYRRHGFVETGERGNGVGDPWMVRIPQ